MKETPLTFFFILVLRLRNNDHLDFVRGLSWSPVDDSLSTSGWDSNVFNYFLGKGPQSSDLAVEFSKSQATSVSMETDGVPPHVNGNVNGMHGSDSGSNEENMEIEQNNQAQNNLKTSNSGSETSEKSDKEESVSSVNVARTTETSSSFMCDMKPEECEASVIGTETNGI